MFLYTLYLIFFTFVPISHLLAQIEGDFAEKVEKSDTTEESPEINALREKTKPNIPLRRNSADSANERIKKGNIADPTPINPQLKETALKKYKTSVLFKDTRADRYFNQAKALSPDLQQLLVDLNKNKTSSSAFQSSHKETLDDVRNAISKVEDSTKGAFYSKGDRSSKLLEDLKNLEKNLKTRVLSPMEKTQEGNMVKSGLEFINKWIEEEKEQKKITERDKMVRSSDRQKAKPGTVDDYIADSAFNDATSQKDPILDPQKVTDQKHTVLTQQLKTLQGKLTELKDKDETLTSSSQEAKLNRQIAEIQNEINDIHQELIKHHTELHKNTVTYITKLKQEKDDLEKDNYIDNQVILDKYGNKYKIGSGRLFDLKNSIQKLTKELEDLSEKISETQRMIKKNEMKKQQNSRQIQTLTNNSIPKIDATIKELESKKERVEGLLQQSFTERVTTERKEGGSVKEAKGIIKTGKAAAKLSDSALTEQKQNLTSQLQDNQTSKAQTSAEITTLKSENNELSQQNEKLQTTQTELEQQLAQVEKEKTNNEDWLNIQTSRLESERKDKLKEVNTEIAKAKAAIEYHNAQIQQPQPTTVQS